MRNFLRRIMPSLLCRFLRRCEFAETWSWLDTDVWFQHCSSLPPILRSLCRFQLHKQHPVFNVLARGATTIPLYDATSPSKTYPGVHPNKPNQFLFCIHHPRDSRSTAHCSVLSGSYHTVLLPRWSLEGYPLLVCLFVCLLGGIFLDGVCLSGRYGVMCNG